MVEMVSCRILTHTFTASLYNRMQLMCVDALHRCVCLRYYDRSIRASFSRLLDLVERMEVIHGASILAR